MVDLAKDDPLRSLFCFTLVSSTDLAGGPSLHNVCLNVNHLTKTLSYMVDLAKEMPL
jgi:hypothetical protein